MESLEHALCRVEDLLGGYPAPQTEACGCEACAQQAQLIAQGMAKSPKDLSREEVFAAVWMAYSTWCADWYELAHFIPAALRFLEQDSALGIQARMDPEMLYKKLLVSAWPEFDSGFAPETVMPPRDRQAIFNALAALLLREAGAPDEAIDSEALTDLLGFLAQFDGPILPVLDAWRNDPRGLARARLCAVMAASAVHRSRRSFFGNSYLDGAYRPLPLNAEAMEETFSPTHIARFILEHTDDLGALTEEEADEVEIGWQVAAQAAGF